MNTKMRGSSGLSIGMAVIATLLLSVSGGGALAQSDEGLEEIIVTARKRAESLQELALSVSALGEREIRANFATDMRDLIYMSPNTLMDDTHQGPGGVAATYIRGVGVSEVEKNFDPAVGAVVDGVFLGTMSGGITRAIDLERVEVLRGPQGTLFGRNTIGGVVKVDRSRPTMNLGGKVRASYGDYDTSMLDTVLNIGNGDNFGLKLTGSLHKQDEGYFKNIATGRDMGRSEYSSIGANLLWIPQEGLELEWTSVIEETEEDSNVLLNVGQPSQAFCSQYGWCAPNLDKPTSGDRYKTQQAFASSKASELEANKVAGGVELVNFNHNGLSPDDTTFEADTHQLEVRWDINDDLLLEYIGASWETEETVISDWDAVPVLLFHTDRPAEYEQTSHELRLTFDDGGKLRGTVGAYYWDSEYEIRLISWIGFGFSNPSWDTYNPPLNLPQTTNQESESKAVFFEGDYDLMDQLTLTVGLRYTEDEKSVMQRGQVPCAQSDAHFNENLSAAESMALRLRCDSNDMTPISASETWEETTPKLALKYEINEDAMVYGLYSRGYRAGGFNGRVDSIPAAVTPYDPETVDNFELGYRSEWMDRTITFNATLFRMNYKDKQEEIQFPSTTSGTGQATLVVNASEATIQGLELELAWLAAEGLTLRGNLGWLDAEYDSFSVNTNRSGTGAPTIVDHSDKDFRRAPEVTFGLSSDYRFDLGPGTAQLWASLRYLDEHEVDFANKPELTNDTQTLVDVSFTWEYENYYASIFGRNLTEEDGYQIGFDVANLWSYAAPRAPRTYGVEVGLRFGN